MVAKDGRFGVYVTDGETNASLGSGDRLEEMSPERAYELLAMRRETAGRTGPAEARRRSSGRQERRRKKAAAKKAGGQEGARGRTESAAQEGPQSRIAQPATRRLATRRMARYIAFEGGEGSGKSTQARRWPRPSAPCSPGSPAGRAIGALVREIAARPGPPSWPTGPRRC